MWLDLHNYQDTAKFEILNNKIIKFWIIRFEKIELLHFLSLIIAVSNHSRMVWFICLTA